MNQGLSDTDICNAALAAVGGQAIQSLNDQSNQARACKAVYFIARDAALRSHPWNFARIWTTLAQLAIAPPSLRMKPNPNTVGDILFTAAYQLPADCIRVYRASPYNYNFRIAGTALYTDAPTQAINTGSFAGAQPGVGLGPFTVMTNPDSIGIEYISRTADPSMWDAGFVEALTAKVAAEIAWPVAASMQLKGDLEKAYQSKLMEAWFADGAENWGDELYNSMLVDVRLNAGGDGWW